MRTLHSVLSFMVILALGLMADSWVAARDDAGAAGTRGDATGAKAKPEKTMSATSAKTRSDNLKFRVKEKADPQQKANLDQLKTDLQGLKDKSEVTADQKEQLKEDLSAALQGAQKPAPETVDKLAADLAACRLDGKLTNSELLGIQEDVNALLNSANVSDDDLAAIQADLKAILKSSKLTEADLQMILTDVQAIAATAQQNLPAPAEGDKAATKEKPATGTKTGASTKPHTRPKH